jgi:hypothetical protein
MLNKYITFLYRSLKKGNVVYIISFIKVKASIELSIAAHFFIIIRQGKIHLKAFLEIIESVVSSPFVKAEADSVEYVVPCLKRYVRLH